MITTDEGRREKGGSDTNVLTISGLGRKLHGTMHKRHARAANLATQCNVYWYGHCMHAVVSCHTLLLLHIQS